MLNISAYYLWRLCLTWQLTDLTNKHAPALLPVFHKNFSHKSLNGEKTAGDKNRDQYPPDFLSDYKRPADDLVFLNKQNISAIEEGPAVQAST